MKKPKQFRTAFSLYTSQGMKGEGGCGTVYSVTDESGSDFALKVLDPRKANRDKTKRFQNEYHFCSRKDHPNIVRVVDYGLAEDGAPFFVMPLYEMSLRYLIGALAPKDAFEVFTKILDGVEAAHFLGVIHRDLKPENILFNNLDDIVVADFGIARFEAEELLTAVETKDGNRLANFAYAAPEQRVRGREVDHRADLYALGLILNELFTRELAQGTGFKKIESVSEDYAYLDIIVDRLLHQQPESRFQSIDELKKEISVRGKDQVSRQTISRLRNTVISTSEVDDPIVADPMRVVGFDWDNGMLLIKLNHTAHMEWQRSFCNMGNFQYILGKKPENFQFGGNVAAIHAGPNEVQQVIDFFKKWLETIAREYEHKVRSEQARKEREESEALQRKIEQEEQRAKILREVTF